MIIVTKGCSHCQNYLRELDDVGVDHGVLYCEENLDIVKKYQCTGDIFPAVFKRGACGRCHVQDHAFQRWSFGNAGPVSAGCYSTTENDWTRPGEK